MVSFSLSLSLSPPTPGFLEETERRRREEKGGHLFPVGPPAPLYRGFGNEEEWYAGWDGAGRGGGFIAPESMGVVDGAGDMVARTRAAGD